MYKNSQVKLVKVLAATTSGNTDRFVHGPRGIHAQEDDSGDWTWPVQDGLGSVRGVLDDASAVDSVQSYAPYGEELESGPFGSPFTFTGEQTDANGLVYLRARYYSPALGAFTALDPIEQVNRYQYVGGNGVNAVDPSGLQGGCNQGDCGVIMPVPGPITTANGYDIVLEAEMYVDAYWQGVQVAPSHLGPAGPISPGSYVPGTNIATVVIYEPTYASIDVLYRTTLGPSAIEHYFNGQVIAIYDGAGQWPLWLISDGEPLPETTPDQTLIPQSSGNPGLVSPPMSYTDPILQAIAQNQCLETPDPSNKRCDPAKTWAWMLGRGKKEPGIGAAYDYQRHYAGRMKYDVDTGIGETVEADGARPSDCALIETKYVGSPLSSPYVIGSTSRGFSFMSDLNDIKSVDYEQNDEFRRYGDALRAPDSVNPFVKLIVITNTIAAFPYFQYWINRNGVPNAAVRYEPGP